MHHTPCGGFLDAHLDCDRHPRTGFRRAVNVILFFDDFVPADGGALRFWRPDLSTPAIEVFPRANRLVAFECGDVSYHSVSESRKPRNSLAVYWWEPEILSVAKRPRALFVATRDETPDPAKEAWRKDRAQ
jgi:Rps23 Pro-64 3,4-dihydroxylase Tpa1-like proline 4-hydroxylase